MKIKLKKIVVTPLIIIASYFLTMNISVATDNIKQAIEQRIAPIGKVNVAAEKNANTAVITTPTTQSVTSSQTVSGEQIFADNCKLCHETGAAGAPKIGDKAQWQPRIVQGIPTLIQHALHGYKVMPPKGGCIKCTEAEISAAVIYMVNKSK